jgi:hypothetical protein
MSNRTPAIIVGFGEGFFAPIVELLVGVLIGATLLVSDTVSSATGAANISNNIALTFTIIASVDILRNIIISFSHSQFAVGNIAGNICGLFLFYGSISVISPESVNSSIFWTIIMLISLIIGIFITVWKLRQEQNTYY